MSSANTLASRIDAEFASLDAKVKQFQAEVVRENREREGRLQRLSALFDELSEVWRPRLEVLVKKFGDKVKVTPSLTPSRREATFQFQSDLGNVTLRFSASTDRDVTQVILTYDLRIIPVLMKFEDHSELAFPLDAVDREAIGRWVDDRIVNFVRTYLAMHEHEFYHKGSMVEDPIAGVRFPKYAAGATLEWQGRTVYFVNEETRREFEKRNGVAAK